jgi:sugar/nucleoside kinase (ribokinase family)
MKINKNEEKVLKILEKDPFVSQKFIAEQLSLSRPAVANLISGLQNKGYILGKPYLLRTEEYITCVGGANLDYTFRLTDEMILSTSNPVNSSVSYGGVVRNIAENLARLNHKVSLMSVVGDDNAGNDLLSFSKKIMEVIAVDQLTKKKTGSYYSVINKEGNMQVGFADMSINSAMNLTWILEHKRHLNLSSWIIADTNITKDALESLVDFSRNEEKKLVIIGVSGPKMKSVPDDLNDIEAIICNVDETQSYFNTQNNKLDHLCQLWLNKGIKKVVVTAGKNGCVYGENEKINYQKAIIVPSHLVVDVTGAGDAFSAGVLHGLISNEPLESAVKYGVISSSLTIQENNAVNQKLSINLIKKELERNEKL